VTGPTLRLFVAVYPPARFVTDAMSLLSRLTLPPHRPTPPGLVHLTLQFVGNVSRLELNAVRESVERAASGIAPFDLTAIRLVTLPHRGPARLVALETDTPPGLLEIQRRLVKRLSRSPRDRPGDAFLPHITLARFDGGAVPGVRVDERFEPLSFRVEHVVLMRSVLSAAGAEHREDQRIELGS